MGISSAYRNFFSKSTVVLLALGLLLSACTAETPPLPSATPSPAATLTPTLTPTRTPTPTSTFTPTPSMTPTPLLAGTPLPLLPEGILELNLDRVVELARWGRGSAADLAASPDGYWLALASPLGVYLYSTPSLQLAAVFDSGPARGVTFSPSASLLAVAADTLQIWDITSKSLSIESEPIEPALDVQFSLDGARLALLTRLSDGSAKLQIRLAVDGSLETSHSLNWSTDPVSQAAFSPDLTLLAAITTGGQVRLVRVSDGAQLSTLPPEAASPARLAFSPDGQQLAVGYSDPTFNFTNEHRIILYRLPDGQPQSTLFAGQAVEGVLAPLVSLAFSADGTQLAAGFTDRSVSIGSPDSKGLSTILSGAGVSTHLVFLPGSRLLAGSGVDVWDTSGPTWLASLNEHFNPPNTWALSPDGRQLALLFSDQVELRQVSDGKVERVIGGFEQPVNDLAYAPDGFALAGASAEGTTRLWRASDGRYLANLEEPGQPRIAVAYSPDQVWMAVADATGRVWCYDRTQYNRLMFTFVEGYLPGRLLYSPDGQFLAALTSSGVSLRYSATGEQVRFYAGIGLTDFAFSPDSGLLAVAGNDTARVLDLYGSGERYVLQPRTQGDDSPWSVAFSPDYAFLAVGWQSGKIELFWAGDGAYMRTLTGHRGPVYRLAFTPGGRLLLSASQDGTIRVWGPN